MFHHEANYPTAVTSSDDEGLRAGFQWCIDHMADGDHLTVWTHLKSNLGNNQLLQRFVSDHRDVDHVTARGGAYLGGPGPVLMAWADPNDVAELVRSNSNRIRALCVVSWNEDRLQPWVSAVHPELLGDTSAWQEQTPALNPVVEEGMKSLTLTINHNNTIAAGYEKDEVVSMLLALHDAGYALDGPALAGWAIAHGWTGRNPGQLEKYIEAIQRGSRPRVRRDLRAGYVDYLKSEAAEHKQD